VHRVQAYRYTGMWPMPMVPPWGAASMHAGSCRQCRKESRELLVSQTSGDDRQREVGRNFMAAMAEMAGQAGSGEAEERAESNAAAGAAAVANQVAQGTGQAFIGGGCCVSLSVEYAPNSPTVAATVSILVFGSDGTSLAWQRVEQPGVGYTVKECVITANPGSNLLVVAQNCTARVRWCEIFSC
jgi:hypothetical protein